MMCGATSANYRDVIPPSGTKCRPRNEGKSGPDAGSACQLKGTEMHINPAIVGALSALVGAIIGAAASLAAAIYTQRYQNRLQRIVREISKRETVYADFIISASSLLLKAYVTEGFKLNGEEEHLIGLLNRMRLFAPPTIIDTADAVIRRIIEISLQPSLDLRKLTMADLSKNPDSCLLYTSPSPRDS